MHGFYCSVILGNAWGLTPVSPTENHITCALSIQGTTLHTGRNELGESEIIKMEKCQCSFWRKCCPCLCRCKPKIESSANMERTCSCSIWRKFFCLCRCKPVVEERDNKSDLFTKFASKNISQNVTELHSINCLKYQDEVCSGKSYSPIALFNDGKLVNVDSRKLIEKKCEREVAMLSGGLNGQNILKFIGIYFKPNSSLPVLVTEKIEFSLLQHIETSLNYCLQVSENYKLLYDICSGLNYLHNAKIVHLNLSTKSVLLTEKLVPKISNFEYAMYSHPPKDFASLSKDDLLFIRSRDDHFMFHFLPPDYLEILQEQDHCILKCIESTDVYSFGCLVLNMFSRWPSVPYSSEEDICSPKECQNFWLSVISKSDTEISDIVKNCLDRNTDHEITTQGLLKKLKSVTKAKEVTINPPLKKKMGKDSCKFTDKSDRVQTTILQPNPANNTTRIQPKVKHVAIQTQCKLIKNSSSQTENVTFKNKRSQTNQVEFKGTSTQTEGAEKDNLKDTSLQRSKFKDTSSHADAATAKIERCSVMQGQLRLSLEKNKMLLERINELEKELVSLTRIVEDKNEELEKYHAKCIKAEEESFAFTNAFSTACEGSVSDLQNVYRHMQHNVRSAAVCAHKKRHPNIPLQLSYHGTIAYDKAKSIVFQAFSDILNKSLFEMQPPYSEPIQPEQDNTLKQCMKLLACFHESVKHAEQEIKQGLLQEYRKLTKHTSGIIPEDVEKYYSMLAKFTWDCVARTIPMIMSTEETKFNKEMHELKDYDEDDDDDKEEKHISYVYPILFTSNSWPREVAVKGKVKY